MPLQLGDSILMRVSDIIGLTKLFQESNKVLLGLTLEFAHKLGELIPINFLHVTIINTI